MRQDRCTDLSRSPLTSTAHGWYGAPFASAPMAPRLNPTVRAVRVQTTTIIIILVAARNIIWVVPSRAAGSGPCQRPSPSARARSWQRDASVCRLTRKTGTPRSRVRSRRTVWLEVRCGSGFHRVNRPPWNGRNRHDEVTRAYIGCRSGLNCSWCDRRELHPTEREAQK